jgi:hypothetical protein
MDRKIKTPKINKHTDTLISPRLLMGLQLSGTQPASFQLRSNNPHHDTQRYWVFGLCPSSGFFLNNNEKHNVSETGCFHPQVREDTYSVGSLRKSFVI